MENLFKRVVSKGKSERAVVALSLFLLFRMSLVFITLRFPEGAALVDSRAYMAFASTIIQGATYTDLNSPPGYPFFIALASGWSTPSFVWTVFWQLLLSSTAALLLVPIGEKVCNKRAGLLAGWLYALSPNAGLWALTVMSETVFAILLVVSLWMWLLAKDGSNLLKYTLLGLVLGSGAMIRNIGLLLIPVWIILNVLRDVSRKRYLQAVKTSMTIATGSAILLIAWGVHNKAVHGEFMVTEEHSRTFYVFNVATVLAAVEDMTRDQAAAIMSTSADPLGITLDLLSEHPIIFAREQGKGVLRSLFGVSSGAWARAFGYPLEMQGSFQLLGELVSGNLGRVGERVRTLTESSETTTLLILSILGLGHTTLQYGLSIGVFAGRKMDPWTLLILIFTILLLILSPGSVGQARFRVPVEPFLALLAAVGWQNFRRVREG